MDLRSVTGPINRRRFVLGALLIGATALWIAWLFGPCLLGDQRLAFRDISHFYLPLYGYLGERLAAEGLPLWNPLDRFGIPVAGETTTAIFYPPRLLFACGLPADYAMTLYVLGHLLLAGGGAYWVARSARARPLASLSAAVVYPAAGPVFFLYTNPPFLVGAAWLPWMVGGLLVAVHRPSRRVIALASIALAMAVLGGDPQVTFHAVLFAMAYWAVRRLAPKPLNRSGPVADRRSPPPRLVPLVACVLIAIGLSSLQIFAGAAWSLQSWRHHSQPASLYTRLAAISVDERADSADQSLPATSQQGAGISKHEASVYDYSVAPWHWAELASPLVFGPLLPEYGRLSMLIPGEPRIWTLTLYAGLLPLICLLAGPLDPRRWTVWHALVAAGLLLSLGEFGLARLLRGCLEIVGLAMPAGVHDAAGGGYWALVTFIPGYGQFRYPAKWLPFASLGMAVWTAIYLSRCASAARRRLSGIAGILSILAPAALAVTWLPYFSDALAELASSRALSDRFWGPLDISAGLQALRLSLAATSLLAACYAVLFRCSPRRATCPQVATPPPPSRNDSIDVGHVDPRRAACPQVATPPPPSRNDSIDVGHVDPRRAACPQVATPPPPSRQSTIDVGHVDPRRATCPQVASQLTACCAAIFRRPGAAPRLSRRTIITLALGLLIGDLALSTSWQLASVDRAAVPPAAGTPNPTISLSETGTAAPLPRFVSTAAPGDWPSRWRSTGSPDRIAEVEAGQRAGWFMRWHLADSAAVVNSPISIASARTTIFWDEARQYADDLQPTERRSFVEALYRYLGVTATFDHLISARGEEDRIALRFHPIPDPLPLVRWHSVWRSTPKVEVAAIPGQLRDLFAEIERHAEAAIPQVEGDEEAALLPGAGPRAPNTLSDRSGEASNASPVELISWQPDAIRLRVDAARAGLVTVQQLQDGFWTARIKATNGPPTDNASSNRGAWDESVVHRVDGIAQGIFVPAGRYEIEFRYRPDWLLPGLILTAATIIGLLVGCFWTRGVRVRLHKGT